MGADLAARRSTAALNDAPLRPGLLLLLSGLAFGLAPAAMAQLRTPAIQASPAVRAPLLPPSTTPLVRVDSTVQGVQPTPALGSLPTGPQSPSAPASAGTATTATSPGQPARLNTGLVTIESDVQRADQTTGVVTASGNVRIVYPDQRVVATARQAQYFSKEGRVVLSGDVDLVQEGGNLMRAEQVVYLVDSERLTAIPPQGQQVFSRLRMQQAVAAPAASQQQTVPGSTPPQSVSPSAVRPQP